MATTPKWSPQHYNALAKEIRELFPTAWNPAEDITTIAQLKQRDNRNLQRATLATLALNLAKRFKEDNPEFDPLKFLDACSPNRGLYPLSELWENDD